MINDILSYTIALFFGILSIFFFVKGRKQRQPQWTYRNDYLVGNRGIDAIRILYKGKEVNQVTSTKLFIWNKGREVIRGQDVPVSDPISLAFLDKTQVLGVQLLRKTRDALAIDLVQEDHKGSQRIRCNFNFLDHNDGFVSEIVHTGGRDTRPVLNGTVLGAKSGFKYIKSFAKYEDAMGYSVFLGFGVLFAFAFIGKIIPALAPIINGPKTTPLEITITIASILAIFILTILISVKIERKQHPYRKLWE